MPDHPLAINTISAPPAHLAATLAPLFGRRVALAVSGGSDSTALMHLAAHAATRFAAQPLVLTLDHGLRPAASVECAAVAAQAALLGLPCERLSWDGAKPAGNLQAEARAARYRLLAAAARRHGANALVTAHTLDDQAETFLIALGRGSGVYGLSAMPMTRNIGNDLTLERPLLATAKADLVAWLDSAGIAYITDPSNADTRFARARIRAAADALSLLGLTPMRLADTARRMARAAAALDAAADALINFANPFGPAVSLPIAALRATPEEIRLRTLARLLSEIGGRPYPPRLDRLEALECALARANDAHAPLKRTLAGVAVLLRPDGTLWLAPEAGRTGFQNHTVIPGQTIAWDHRTDITPLAPPPNATLTALGPSGATWIRARDVRASAMPATIIATLPALMLAETPIAIPDLSFIAAPGAPAIRLERRGIGVKAVMPW